MTRVHSSTGPSGVDEAPAALQCSAAIRAAACARTWSLACVDVNCQSARTSLHPSVPGRPSQEVHEGDASVCAWTTAPAGRAADTCLRAARRTPPGSPPAWPPRDAAATQGTARASTAAAAMSHQSLRRGVVGTACASPRTSVMGPCCPRTRPDVGFLRGPRSRRSAYAADVAGRSRRARVEDVHDLALAMPHVTVDHGTTGNPVYQVGGKSFVFFRTPRPDAVDPVTGERFDDVVVFWVADEADKQSLVQDPASPFFTTAHFDGHPSVLLRASRGSELTREELVEVIEEAWLAQASDRRGRAWLASRDLEP